MQVVACMENLRNLSRKLTKRVRNAAVTRKVTVVTLTLLEVFGQLVPGKLVFVVRNLKLIGN